MRRTRTPTGERAERLAELSAAVERLVRVMDLGYIPVWLREPVIALDDEKSLDVLARGEYRRLSRVISELESPTFSWGPERSPARLKRVAPISVGGVFFRHVPGGGIPLFRPERPADGRWQRGEVVEGFYLAGNEQSAWA
jgi:hypothetical protein